MASLVRSQRSRLASIAHRLTLPQSTRVCAQNSNASSYCARRCFSTHRRQITRSNQTSKRSVSQAVRAAGYNMSFSDYFEHEPDKLSKREETATIQKVVFLGTSSATPMPGVRNTSSLAMILSSGKCILVDCGDGTQLQCMMSQSVKMGKIDTILITHLHGDHCFGLPGLLSSMKMQPRSTPVTVMGPTGIRKYVQDNLRTTGDWNGFPIRIAELTKDESYSNMIITDGLSVSAHPLVHSTQTYGYVVRERDRSGKLLHDKAEELGAKAQQLGVLKSGKDVVLADGRTVHAADVLEPPQKGLGVAVLQDSYDSSRAEAACKDVDLLIHECTYSQKDQALAEAHRHSTAAYAGQYAQRVGAKCLALTHFSTRYKVSGLHAGWGRPVLYTREEGPTASTTLSIDDLVREAAAECKDIPVVAAGDFFTIHARKLQGRRQFVMPERSEAGMRELIDRPEYYFDDGLKIMKHKRDTGLDADIDSSVKAPQTPSETIGGKASEEKQ